MSLVRIGLRIVASLFGMQQGVQAQENSEDLAMKAVMSRYELANYVNSLPETQGDTWTKVEVLIDFESEPVRIFSYMYEAGSAVRQLQLSMAPPDLWQKLYDGGTMGLGLVPKQIQMTICRGMQDAFPFSVFYSTQTYGGRSLSGVLSEEDHNMIAASLTETCDREE